MKTGTFRRAIIRLRRNAGLCLPALALALALGTVVVTPPDPSPLTRPIAIPQVNWNS